MIMTSRTIWDDGGTLKDISLDVNDFKAGSRVLDIQTADKLYIGSDFAFNHRYINVKVPNANVSSVTVEVWDGEEWIACEDVIDQTAIAGASLAQSGIISWVPDADEGWMRESTNDESEQVTGLTSLKIRDLFWARLSWSGAMTNTTEVDYIGHKFSDDLDLAVFYPDMTRTAVLTQFKSGKTTWLEQHLQAAQEIIKDLKKTRIVKSPNQLLNWELFKDASSHKVAEIVFNAFGKDFYENRDAARKQYKQDFDKAIYHVDQNNDAILSVRERTLTEGKLYR